MDDGLHCAVEIDVFPLFCFYGQSISEGPGDRVCEDTNFTRNLELTSHQANQPNHTCPTTNCPPIKSTLHDVKKKGTIGGIGSTVFPVTGRRRQLSRHHLQQLQHHHHHHHHHQCHGTPRHRGGRTPQPRCRGQVAQESSHWCCSFSCGQAT